MEAVDIAVGVAVTASAVVVGTAVAEIAAAEGADGAVEVAEGSVNGESPVVYSPPMNAESPSEVLDADAVMPAGC